MSWGHAGIIRPRFKARGAHFGALVLVHKDAPSSLTELGAKIRPGYRRGRHLASRFCTGVCAA